MRSRGALLALGIGALAGLASGLLGIGGGLIAVPLAIALLDVPIKRAVGTSLLSVLVTASVGVATELLVAPDNIRWVAAAWLAAGAVAGTAIGARIVKVTPARRLALLMAALLMISAMKMAGVLESLTLPLDAASLAPVARALLHVAAGLVAGIVAAMFGVGGGIIAVPALAALHASWTFQACRATSLAMIVPASLAGALLHRKLDHVDLDLARGMVPGSIVGAITGVVLANEIPERPLELAFAALLVVSAIQLARPRRVETLSGRESASHPTVESGPG